MFNYGEKENKVHYCAYYLFKIGIIIGTYFSYKKFIAYKIYLLEK